MLLLNKAALLALAISLLVTKGTPRSLPTERGLTSLADTDCVGQRCKDNVEHTQLSRRVAAAPLPRPPVHIGDPEAPVTPGQEQSPGSPPNQPDGAPRFDGDSTRPNQPTDEENPAPPARIGQDEEGQPDSTTTQTQNNEYPRLGASDPDDPGFTDKELIGDPLTQEQLAARRQQGRLVDDKVLADLKSNRETVDPMDQQEFDQKYNDEVHPRQQLDEDFDRDLEQPINDLQKGQYDSITYDQHSVTSKVPPQNPQGEGVIARAMYFQQQRMIVGEERYSSNDGNLPDARIRTSSLLINRYEAGANGRSVPLDAFIGREVQATVALQMMTDAYKTTGTPLGQKLVLRRTGRNDGESEAFKDMLGVPFIQSLNYALMENKIQLGRIHITEIRVYPRTWAPGMDDFDNGWQKKVTIVVRFGPLDSDAPQGVKRLPSGSPPADDPPGPKRIEREQGGNANEPASRETIQQE